MNKKEDYFRFTKEGHIHTLCTRIPFKWNELMVLTATSFILLIILMGWIGLFVAILTLIAYTIFRFASSIYYAEIKIDEANGKLIRVQKFLDKTRATEVVTDKFDPKRFEFKELTRSGETKFLLNYRTHKNNELLVVKNEADKRLIEKYFAENLGQKN